MQKIFLTICFALLIFGAANAQSYRVRDLADQVSQQADEFADRAYNDYVRASFKSRSALDSMMLAQQIGATANAFRRLTQERLSDSELGDAAAYLVELKRRLPSGFNSQSYNLSRAIDDLARELRIGNSNGNNGGSDNQTPDNADIIGRVRWRGSVDDEVQLVIRNNTLEARTISGTQQPPGNYNFTSALPNRRVNVAVNKTKGRGSVSVLQQPRRENDFTTVIQLKDNAGGAREYDLEIYWTR